MRSIFIVNPASGAGRTGRQWPAIRRLANESGLDFEFVLTTRPREATDIARRAVYESRRLVVAVGGDGTLNEVVAGFFDGTGPIPTSSNLGLLPSGTGDDTRRTFGIPVDPEAAIRVLNSGRPRRIDAGKVSLGANARYFLNIAEAGFGAEVSRRSNRIPKTLGGATYSLVAIACLLTWRHKHLNVTVDDRIHRETVGQAVVIANCQFYGSGMWVAPQAIPDDGFFDVIVVGAIGKMEAVLKMKQLYKGTHFADPQLQSKLEVIRGTKVVVSSPDRVLVQLDGEVAGHLPMTFEIVRHALSVMVPMS